MLSSKLIQSCLDDAFRVHFDKLFSILMSEQTEEQWKRFLRGFDNSVKMYERIEKEIVTGWPK